MTIPVAGLRSAACLALGVLSAGSAANALDPDQVSRTAISVACSRALMARADDPAIQNPDHLAEKLLDAELRRLAPGCALLELPFDQAYLRATQGPMAWLALGVVLRTRHIDSALETSLNNGVEQVVILGAGLDTRAYRMSDNHPTVRFFEVDSPATQQDKKDRVRQLLGALPTHVVFVPMDFETQDLKTELSAAGYDSQSPAFFVWEGVTMYLHPEAVDVTLAFVAENSASGSEIVFDYVYASVIDGTYPEPPQARAARNAQLESFGEPWLFGIPQGEMQEFVEQRGLEFVSDLSLPALVLHYLGSSVKPPGTPPGVGIAIARVRQ